MSRKTGITNQVFAFSESDYAENFLLENFISMKLNFLVSSMFSCVTPQNTGFRPCSHVTRYDSYLGKLYANGPCVHTFPSLSAYFTLLSPENVYLP